jgi:hypothetical protein
MSDWIDDLNEKQEAFTLGGGLGEHVQPTAGYDAVPQARTERPLRKKTLARRKSMRLRNASFPGSGSSLTGSVGGSVSASAVLDAESEIEAPPGGLEKDIVLPAADTTQNFFSLLKQAIHSNEGILAEASAESANSETPASEVDAELDLVERKELKQEWSVRIVIPRSAALDLKAIVNTFTSGWNLMRKQVKFRPAKKRLRICETISLGEKRFVALVEVDGEQFLLGGASGSVTPIARLETPKSAPGAPVPLWTQDAVQA